MKLNLPIQTRQVKGIRGIDLLRAREAAGLSQQGLADALGGADAGWYQLRIHRLEKQEWIDDPEVIEALEILY